MTDDDRVTGSFFHAIPEDDADSDDKNSGEKVASEQQQPSERNQKEEEKSEDEFQRSLNQILEKRRSKPRAASPSTLGGVPTAKATGFGKASPKIIKGTNAKKPFVGIGTPDKKLNDINNPEYDDQGYTLYADENTGEKSRVFEALIEYPCKFQVKIVGANEGSFATEMVALVAESCKVEAADVAWKERKNGKWTSVTVSAPVESAEMLYELYENIDRDPRVKFKF
eukprot:CAMPEP_0195515186 /NCGR_PEP_ID=MMETSP0794_2-20130614/6346_1 /TAXON_ID=515487 /ORGANISM="Stephanopyxis turris, Strain CCMP 815" /LENGTH=225 /DNA_ID=CAMNT_0040643577 /DNA_START=238 /DNA_END=915 /DNA_ORIENTATION=-